MVALLLISLTATASIWAYFSRAEVTLDNAARVLAQDLRIAQNRASLLHAPVAIVFAPDGDGYRMVDCGDERLSSAGAETISRSYSRDAVFEGVHLEALDLGAEGRVVFDARGGVITGGRLRLHYRGEERLVEVQAGQGSISIAGLHGSWTGEP